jgi:hypothetical protein
VPLEEAVQRAVAEAVSTLAKRLPQFLNGSVPLLLQQAQHECRNRLDPTRPTIATQRTRAHISLLALQGSPTAHTGRAHAKPGRRLPMRRTLLNSRQHACPKINRQRL